MMRSLPYLSSPSLSVPMLICLLLTCLVLAPSALAAGNCADQPYEVNPDASQDLIEGVTGFLRCEAGAYALCYYSGASPLPCTLDESGASAECQCQVYTASADAPMYVLMTSILNECVYNETVEQCGTDGSGCYNLCNDKPNSPQCSGVTLPEKQATAAVCDYIQSGTFDKNAAYISTFSFAHVYAPSENSSSDEHFLLGSNNENGAYAGCMTASCSGSTTDSRENTYTNCACPVFPQGGATADYQFGRKCTTAGENDPTSPGYCTLTEQQVWSAAYNPALADD